VSADPVVKDGLNRYSYVGDAPLTATDPSGLFLVVVCGWNQDCGAGPQGHSFDSFEGIVRGYWQSVLGKTAAQSQWLWNLMRWTYANTGEISTIKGFDVAFHDAAFNREEHDEASAVRSLGAHMDFLVAATGQDLTYGYGHSFGALVLHDYLAAALLGDFRSIPQFRGAILNAGPAHWAANAGGIKLYKSDAYHTGGAGMPLATFPFPVVTRGSAAALIGGNLPGIQIDLTVPGALNLPPADPADPHNISNKTANEDWAMLNFMWGIRGQ